MSYEEFMHIIKENLEIFEPISVWNDKCDPFIFESSRIASTVDLRVRFSTID